MKRLILPSLVFIGLLALFNWGTRLAERILDAELPGLLARELGIPVTLAPMQARLGRLTVHSPKLVMGDPADPAIVATDVTVSLAWPDVLNRRLRLRQASAADLLVKPSRWPDSGAPRPADYRFLDPFLPDGIELATGRFVAADDTPYPLANLRWERDSQGATLAGQGTLSNQPVDVAIRLQSLDELLRLARLRLHITTTAAGSQDSRIEADLDLVPGETSGYKLTAGIRGAGMTVHTSAGNPAAWAWPDTSSTDADKLDIRQLRTLVGSYQAPGDGRDPAAWLAAALPHLSLPPHTGHVAVDEIHWRDGVATATSLDFTCGPEGVAIPAFSSAGPGGKLQGKAGITSADSGWHVELTAGIEAAEASQSLAAPYLNADWLWRSGHAQVNGRGESWGALLNSLEGDIALSGTHRGQVETPVTIAARLDNRPGELALDTIDIMLGSGHITGSARLSGDAVHKLSARINADHLNLDFLLPPAGQAPEPGVPLPQFLGLLPGVELDWQVDIGALEVSDMRFNNASMQLVRTPQGGVLTASVAGDEGGKLDLRMDARIFAGKPDDVTLLASLDKIDLPELFQDTPAIHDSRTSGTISFSSKGKSVEQIFRNMQGRADLDLSLRRDRDWQRAPLAGEQLRLAGNARWVIGDGRITGLEITELAVDSLQQNLTGTVSIVEGRKPWLVAELESDRLDIPSLMKLKSPAPATAAKTDLLGSLGDLGEARVALKAKSVLVGTLPMTGVTLQVSSGGRRIEVDQLDFSLDNGRLESRGAISWKRREATLSVDARVINLDLDKFLLKDSPAINAPVSGTISLQGSGHTVAGLLGALTGDITLQASASNATKPEQARRQVMMTVRKTDDGIQAVVRRFQWGATDLSGSVRYHDVAPPLVEIELAGGSLSLLPWEEADRDTNRAANKDTDGSIVTRTARTGIDLVGDIVLAPIRLISGPREAEPGNKLFSQDPLPFARLQNHRLKVNGRLDAIHSREGNASDVTFSATLLDGQLSVDAEAGTLNGGSASIRLGVDTHQQPSAVVLTGTFKNLRGPLFKAGGATRSGYFDVTSRGQSQAELAANVSGLVYLELGPGPLDYGKMMLLTADVATNAFQILIPGSDKTPPQLECAVTLGVFKDGAGITPYGYAARTNLANLVGKVELDLKKELLHLNFSSSSRQGVGISIGNIFSNTVEVEGPLSDPRIVPNATGLLWRGWAAVMTGGLSVVGESVLKRALASENPCLSVQQHIRKDICKTTRPAASSPLVCPAT